MKEQLRNIALATSLLATTTACSSSEKAAPETLPQTPTTLTIPSLETMDPFTPYKLNDATYYSVFKKTVEEAVQTFTGAVGCSTSVVVKLGNDSNTNNEITPASAVRGVITINQYYNPAIQETNGLATNRLPLPLLVHTGLHEAAHACEGEPKPINILMDTQKNTKIVRVEGLNLFTDLPLKDGREPRITLLEEAYAEVAADQVGGASVEDINEGLLGQRIPISQMYSSLRDELLKVLTETGISVKDLVHFHQTSNFYGLMQRVYATEQPTNQQIVAFISRFSVAAGFSSLPG